MLNSYHPSVQFTCDTEENDQLPYLDILIKRNHESNQLETKICSKPTSKGRILNFYSAHSFTLKKNTAFGLINRTFKLTSSHFWNVVETELVNNLTKNSYPYNLIKQWINKSKNALLTPLSNSSQNLNINNDHQTYFKSITYVKGLSGKIRGILKTTCPSVRCALKSSNTIGHQFFTKIKDPTPKEDSAGVVYCIPCINCSKKYIGKTKNKLHDRLRTHKNDERKLSTNTALAEHSTSLSHHFDFSNATIITKEKHLNKRLTLEMIHIKKEGENAVNKRTDIDRLSQIYNNIIVL